jgi:cytochrome b561
MQHAHQFAHAGRSKTAAKPLAATVRRTSDTQKEASSVNWLNDSDRYGKLTVALHWFMLVLLAAVYASMELNDIFPKGSAGRAALKTWHFTLGLSVLALVIVRLALVLISKTPRIDPPPPVWQARIARAMKIALYAFMIVTPTLGWLLLGAKGSAIPFFGLELPALIGADKSLASGIKEVHESFAVLGYLLIGFHAVAGLYHHYVLRDNTLQRMLPAMRTDRVRASTRPTEMRRTWRDGAR